MQCRLVLARGKSSEVLRYNNNNSRGYAWCFYIHMYSTVLWVSWNKMPSRHLIIIKHTARMIQQGLWIMLLVMRLKVNMYCGSGDWKCVTNFENDMFLWEFRYQRIDWTPKVDCQMPGVEGITYDCTRNLPRHIPLQDRPKYQQQNC